MLLRTNFRAAYALKLTTMFFTIDVWMMPDDA